MEPDLIIVGFCLNDPQPKDQNYSVEREKFDKGLGQSLNMISFWLSRCGLFYIDKRIKTAVYRFSEVHVQ